MRFLFIAVLRRSSDARIQRAAAAASPFHRSYSRHQKPPERSFHVSPAAPPCRPSFGIAFDIDGVLLRGNAPIGGATRALKRLYGSDGTLKIPFLFLTNGGGIPESKRASELSRLLGIEVLPVQVVQGHSPFRNLVHRFGNELVVAVGKGEPASVMLEYGFRKAISIDEYSSYFEGIDPLIQYKSWEVKQVFDGRVNQEGILSRHDIISNRVQGVFVVSDPIDWGRDIQVLCDILRTGGLPGKKNGHQPPLYFANDDLEYQSTFPSERLGMGAFRLALESIFNRIHNNALEYASFGKPNPSVFNNAERVLEQIKFNLPPHVQTVDDGEEEGHRFRRLYMVGDNPSVDIQGARKAGDPWYSILTRTGVFKGRENHTQFPADLVVDTVEDAIEFILKEEKA